MKSNTLDKMNQRTNKFTIVFNDNELQLFKNPKNIVQKFIDSEVLDVSYIACIKHDRDIDNVDNHVKTTHYHVVLELNKVCRVGTMLNWISSNFVCNENQVSIDKCNDLAMQSRYLLHLDEIDKVRYYENEVVVNNQDKFKFYLELVKITDMKSLIAFVKDNNYDLEVIMSKLVHYDRYRRYIQDLIINHNRQLRC